MRGTIRRRALLALAIATVTTAGAWTLTAGAHPHETGAIEGLVYSVELEPIAGATLSLHTGSGDQLDETHTGTDGSYAFPSVDVGTYRLVASAHGHHPEATRVDVVADATTTVNFVLEEETVPWMDRYEWRGFISCWISSTADCRLLDPNHSTQHEIDVAAGLRTVVTHLDWQPHGFLGADAMRFVVRDDHGGVLAEVTGGPPLQIRIDDAFEDTSSITLSVEPTEASIVYQQTFDVWTTLHYLEPAPEGHSPVPQ